MGATMLKNKVAAIYGSSGAVGSAIAGAFAREGARVFLTGRNLSKVDAVAKGIVDAGWRAEAAQRHTEFRGSSSTKRLRARTIGGGCRLSRSWPMWRSSWP